MCVSVDNDTINNSGNYFTILLNLENTVTSL